MGLIGYHCSHEQYPPSELLASVIQAERAGFQAAMCSDHFYPWTEQQGHSGFAWSWLGAALHATKLPFGIVNAPGYRYHPAIVAQAAATLAEMFPGRFWLSIGSGEALNEHIIDEPWPPKDERKARLQECVDIIRALLAGETVTHRGLVSIRNARLYSLPQQPPPLIGAAVSAETAAWVASWADGMITVVRDRPDLEEVIDAFRNNGGEHKPIYLQAQTCYAATEERACELAFEQWRANTLESQLLSDLETPAEFEAAAAEITKDDLRQRIRISSDLGQHRGWLEEYFELGFDGVYLHQVGRNQPEFIAAFANHILPTFGAN